MSDNTKYEGRGGERRDRLVLGFCRETSLGSRRATERTWGLHQTNPLSQDTDLDNLSDFAELRNTSTNPLNRDTDGDGIYDDIDKCPLLTEDLNGVDDTDGCPDQVADCPEIVYEPPDLPDTLSVVNYTASPNTGLEYLRQNSGDTLREGMILTLFNVNFELDSDSLRVESYPILEENAKLFNLYPDLRVEIRGHTDSLASDDYNIDLSQRRAESVQRILVNLGVDASRLQAKGYGETQPVSLNNSERGRARNRRVEFFILETGERDESFWSRMRQRSDRQVYVPDDTTNSIPE
ncbi:MAG: hypothetical protein CL946_12055 [Ectothiorhodospiraceae bacterium]|nr:hypothetical protein [Ectothiorhodospiraceae bacterium]